MRIKKSSIAEAKLTSTYSVVTRKDGGTRICNSEGTTVFTMWGINTIRILTASNYVRDDIIKLFPEASYIYTNHHGNNHHQFSIPNTSSDEVLKRCFKSHSGKYDKNAVSKAVDNRKSENKSRVKVQRTNSQVVAEIKEIENNILKYGLIGEEKNAYVKVRVNQGEYRKQLIKLYKHCCLCKVSDAGLLIASHIRPWKDSNGKEKVDVYNGLLLCPNHDRLFDQGYITFDTDKSIVISSHLSQSDRIFMNVHDGMILECKDDCQKYLTFHREEIFEKKFRS